MKIRKMLYIYMCLCVILQCFIKETSNFYFLFFISFLFFLLFVLRCHADLWLVWNSLCSSVSYELMSFLPQPSELLVYGFELPCPAKHYFQKPKLNAGDAAQLIACFLSMPEAPDSIPSILETGLGDSSLQS